MGRPATTRRLTEAEQAQVRERFARGTPVSVLARDFRTSRYFVEQALRQRADAGEESA